MITCTKDSGSTCAPKWTSGSDPYSEDSDPLPCELGCIPLASNSKESLDCAENQFCIENECVPKFCQEFEPENAKMDEGYGDNANGIGNNRDT